MRLKVDDNINVLYKQINGCLGYEFSFEKYDVSSKEIAMQIVDEIVDIFISQSFDHGASWRECKVREMHEDRFMIYITVYFRVRDSY